MYNKYKLHKKSEMRLLEKSVHRMIRTTVRSDKVLNNFHTRYYRQGFKIIIGNINNADGKM